MNSPSAVTQYWDPRRGCQKMGAHVAQLKIGHVVHLAEGETPERALAELQRKLGERLRP